MLKKQFNLSKPWFLGLFITLLPMVLSACDYSSSATLEYQGNGDWKYTINKVWLDQQETSLHAGSFICINPNGTGGDSGDCEIKQNLQNSQPLPYTYTFHKDADRFEVKLYQDTRVLSYPVLYADKSKSPSTAPNVPSALSATESGSNIVLSWTDNSSNETGFVIERSDSGADTFSAIGTASANVTSFTDSTNAADTAYDYRVKAINASFSSGYTSIVTDIVSAPAIPGSLHATTAGAQINLTFNTDSYPDSVIIERSTIGGGVGFSQIGTADPTAGTYFDTTVASSTLYYYRAKAKLGRFYSAYSSEASDTSN